ncbi:MAG: hypothetical protein R3C11_27025 [Planctomycetaceae bacterium]
MSRIFGLHGPADEGGKAASFILQFSQSFEVLDPFSQCLNVTEHHRCTGATTQLMPDTIHIEPVFSKGFAA